MTLTTHGAAMVEGRSLRTVGFIFGAVTVATILIASALVQAHVDGRLSFDEASRQAVAQSSPTLVR